MYDELRTTVERAWDDRSLLQDDTTKAAIREVVELIDKGLLRTAEPVDLACSQWRVNEGVQKHEPGGALGVERRRHHRDLGAETVPDPDGPADLQRVEERNQVFGVLFQGRRHGRDARRMAAKVEPHDVPIAPQGRPLRELLPAARVRGDAVDENKRSSRGFTPERRGREGRRERSIRADDFDAGFARGEREGEFPAG